MMANDFLESFKGSFLINLNASSHDFSCFGDNVSKILVLNILLILISLKLYFYLNSLLVNLITLEESINKLLTKLILLKVLQAYQVP